MVRAGYAGALGRVVPARPIGDSMKGLIGLSVRHTYDEFVGKVAQHRERTVAEIESAAQGRVWVGSDALSRGLVDKLGGLPEAIESAAELAGLEQDTYMLDYIEQQLGFVETLMLSMTAKVLASVDRLVDLPRWPVTVAQALSTLEPMAFVDRLNDPRGIYAYCFCDTQ